MRGQCDSKYVIFIVKLIYEIVFQTKQIEGISYTSLPQSGRQHFWMCLAAGRHQADQATGPQVPDDVQVAKVEPCGAFSATWK